jgi:hypothetical protein
MTLAFPQAIIHHRAFWALTDSLREGREEDLMEWERSVKAWEKDQELPCPYDLPRKGGFF